MPNNSPSSRRNEDLTAPIVLCCLLAGAVFASGTPATSPVPTTASVHSPAAFWRTRENDGINCLYIQLRLLGYAESYEKFRVRSPESGKYTSLQSLAALASEVGFDLVPVKLTYAQLGSLP